MTRTRHELVGQRPGHGRIAGERVGFADPGGRSREESLGERLLGSLLDRAHLMPPQLIAPLVAQEVARMGGRDVAVSCRTTTSGCCGRCRAGG